MLPTHLGTDNYIRAQSQFPLTLCKVVGVNVKTFTPCDDKTHTAKITVTSSKLTSSELFRIGLRLDDLRAFEAEQYATAVAARTSSIKDCHNCVRPIDLGCPDPRRPVALSDIGNWYPVWLEMTISGYEPGAVVNVFGALCYDPLEQLRLMLMLGPR